MASGLKIKPSIPLNLGWINYWNLAPLRHELERTIPGEVQFHGGTPTQVNRWLSDGKVTLAPCSSVCLLRNPTHEVAFPLGVTSTGAVHSVYIGLTHEDAPLYEMIQERNAEIATLMRQALNQHETDFRRIAALIFKHVEVPTQIRKLALPSLAVTPASASSAALSRVLYRLWFGADAYEKRAAETATHNGDGRRPLELLIGDEALQRRGQFQYLIDLGETWYNMTGLPFVFAVWQTTRCTLSPYWRQRVTEAAELAQARMRIEPSYYLGALQPTDVSGRTIDLTSYWKVIQYKLHKQHFASLALFLAMVRQLAPATVSDEALINLMKWESLGAQPGVL